MKSRAGQRQREEGRLEERRSEEKESEERRCRCGKGRKSQNTVFFQWFVAPEGRKVGSLKRRVRSQLSTGAMKNCTAVVARSTFPSQNVQNTSAPDHFGSWDVEKVHAVVARSTFPSENVQSTPGPDHFWKLRCRKSARRCGAKHISKSKCTKHTRFGPLLDLEMSKSARRCGAKHISKSKVLKTDGLGPLLEVQMSKKCRKVHAVVARSTFRSQKCKKLGVLSLFWREDVEKVDTD